MKYAVHAATSRLLLTSLCEYLRHALAGYEFPEVGGSSVALRVFLYGLPEGQEEKTYPFVVVRWAEGEIVSEADGRTILTDTVLLGLGVYSPESPEQAGILLAELIDCLRRALCIERILASRFELVEPLRCAMPESGRQMHKFHLATIETVWNYVWPPRNLTEAGQSQLLSGDLKADSYSAEEVQKAMLSSKTF